MTDGRLEVSRLIAAPSSAVFSLICQPSGHVAIDASGMLQSAEGDPVRAVDDEFLVHMDREALNDRPLGKYDVRVVVTRYDLDALLEWRVTVGDYPDLGYRYGYTLAPRDGGTLVTSYFDWSALRGDPERFGRFPLVAEATHRATLGILARTVEPAAASS